MDFPEQRAGLNIGQENVDGIGWGRSQHRLISKELRPAFYCIQLCEMLWLEYAKVNL